jgi:fatty acid-binding protein DegV
MGGRLSAAAAVTGGLLNIVPIVMLDDGHIEAIAKIRKSTNGFRKFLREKINSDLPDPQYPVIYLHSNNPALTEPIQEEFKYLVSPDNAYRLSICGVVGVHVGPGAIGMAYIARA